MELLQKTKFKNQLRKSKVIDWEEVKKISSIIKHYDFAGIQENKNWDCFTNAKYYYDDENINIFVGNYRQYKNERTKEFAYAYDKKQNKMICTNWSCVHYHKISTIENLFNWINENIKKDKFVKPEY